MKNLRIFFVAFFCLALFSSNNLYAEEIPTFSQYKNSKKEASNFSKKDEINNKPLNQNEEEIYKHSFVISFDKVNGMADEIVYDGAKKLSHLEWDIKNLKMLSLGLDSQFSNGFGARVKFSNAINQGDGKLVDYDWVGDGYDGNLNHDNWTHRSISNVKIKKAQQFDIAGTYSFYKDELKFNFGYKHDHFKWSDYGGSYIYSVTNPETDEMISFRTDIGTFSNDEVGITYKQTFQTPYIGLEYQKDLFDKKIYANIFGNYSNLVSAEDEDIHHQRNIKFNEYFKNGKYYNLGANIFGKVKENIYLGLGYEFVYYPENRGYTITQFLDTGEAYRSEDSAGIKNKYSKISLNLKYNFTTNSNLFY